MLLLTLLAVVFAQKYYDLLGVPKSASDEAIRKAFKKLSLKYHPDKNRGHEEKAQEQFQQIVNAYEILKDPEQRQIYDKFGEEGLKKHGQQQQQQNQYHNYNDMFSSFFQHQQQPQQGQSLFTNTEVYEIDMSSISRFFRREDVWLIFFYKNDDKARMYRDVLISLASKYYGIFRVAAINCVAEDAICDDEFQIYEYPVVWGFEANSRREPVRYNDRVDQDSLAKFAISLMESFVSIVTSSTYPEFQQSTLNAVILFTNKKSTPALLKVLSKELKGKLLFGLVRHTDALIQRFNINRYPTLMVLTNPSEYQGVVYDSNDFKKDQIMKFLREYAYTQKKVKRSSAPRELTSAIKTGSCTTKDSNLCVLFIVEDNSNQILEPLSFHYAEDKIDFYYLSKNKITYTLFPEIESIPALIILKPKKERYVHYGGDHSFNSIQDFIDQVLGGNISFKPMPFNLENSIFNDDL